MSKLIGYARTATHEVPSGRQRADLLAAGVHARNLYTDEGEHHEDIACPELDSALSAMGDGDTLVVTTLDRLGRATAGLLHFTTALLEQGIGLRVLNLGGAVVDTRTPAGRMLFTVTRSLAEMESALRQERSSLKRAAGRSLGGPPQQFSQSQIESARQLLDSGTPATQVAQHLGMSRSTLYRRVGELSATTAATAESLPGDERFA